MSTPWLRWLRWAKRVSIKKVIFCICIVLAVQYLIVEQLRDSPVLVKSWLRTEPHSVSLLRTSPLVRTKLWTKPPTTVLKVKKDPIPCSYLRKNLMGRIPVLQDAMPFEDLEKLHPELEPGGRWEPSDCVANERVAIIIPYRDRENHLKIFMRHMHPLLQKQKVSYAIFVVELAPPVTFNRGLLLNAGFQEARKMGEYDCYIFHDVDLMPEDDRNIYKCEELPRHMAMSISKQNYEEFPKDIFGGIEAIRKQHFLLVNGFSNKFFGWGGEDDDLLFRFKERGINITRWPAELSRYTTLNHTRAYKSPHRLVMLRRNIQRRRSNQTEGLNTLVYQLIKKRIGLLYTWIYIKVRYRRYVVERKYFDLAKNYSNLTLS